MSRIITAAVACLGAAFAASAAHAEGRQDVRHITVRYADLDLSRDQGVETMLRRIDIAARRACDAPQGRVTLQERQAFRACVDAATDNAVVALSAPLVTERYAQRRNGDAPVAVAALNARN